MGRKREWCTEIWDAGEKSNGEEEAGGENRLRVPPPLFLLVSVVHTDFHFSSAENGLSFPQSFPFIPDKNREGKKLMDSVTFLLSFLHCSFQANWI